MYSRSIKKYSFLVLVALLALFINSLGFIANAATSATASGDVNVILYNSNTDGGTTKPDKDRFTGDESGKLPGNENIIPQDGSEILEPANSVDYLTNGNNPGKLPATGSNNTLLFTLLGVSSVFLVAYFLSGKNTNEYN